MTIIPLYLLMSGLFFLWAAMYGFTLKPSREQTGPPAPCPGETMPGQGPR